MFKISIVGSGQFITELALSPETAAKRDPDKFLEFAEEVVKVARQLTAERAQMSFDLDITPTALQFGDRILG